MKRFTSKTQKIGKIGEEIAVKFLKKQKFTIKDQNYTKKWGEIDIVAQNKGKLHFIEVKSVSRENLDKFSRETSEFRPEANVHSNKQKRLARTIETYLLEHKHEGDWQFDILIVFIDLENKKAKIETLPDIIL